MEGGVSATGWSNRAWPLAILAAVGLVLGIVFANADMTPPDTGIYYAASNFEHLYGRVWLADGDYVYSPAFAMALEPLRALGPGPFIVLWTGLMFVSFAIAGRWLAVAFVIGGLLLLPIVGGSTPATLPLQYLLVGNMHVVIPAVIVLGFRWPALWSIVLLTKILPGIGLIWFAVRREWRHLGWAIGATAVAVVVSATVAPSSWADYVGFLWENRATPSTHELAPLPLWVCLPVAAAVIIWGARTDRAWAVPIACGIASLALYQWSYVIVWIGAATLIAPLDVRGQLARLGALGTRLDGSRPRALRLAAVRVSGGSLILRLLH